MWIVPLQSFDKSDSHGADEVWILPVGFTVATPPGIAAQIRIGSADYQSTNNAWVARTCIIGVLRRVARLVSFSRCNLLQQIRVPRLSHPLRFGKLSGWYGFVVVARPPAVAT